MRAGGGSQKVEGGDSSNKCRPVLQTPVGRPEIDIETGLRLTNYLHVQMLNKPKLGKPAARF
jgi:hypothetical protein